MLALSPFLVVEDNPDDALLVGRAFRQAKVLNPLHVVSSGEEALDYLRGQGKFKNREEFPLPGVVLLDLKMPGLDGFELLSWIRQSPELRKMRVVVLSSSDDMRDVNRAYQLGANSFLIKPADFERFVEISQALNGCWMWMAQAPGTALPNPALEPGATTEASTPLKPGASRLSPR
jgi:CheY-like chemotaxis protein